MERNTFNALSAADKFAFAKSGGKVTDPVANDPEAAAHRSIRLAYAGNVEGAKAACNTRQERFAAFAINPTKAAELWPGTAEDWNRSVAFANRW